MTEVPQPAGPSVQSLVDALSIALGRPVLLDDAALAPLAYSRQWGVDAVRSESILGRGASLAVREALLAQSIASARDVVHTPPDPALGMEGRVCMPVRDGTRALGYLWLLGGADDLADADLARLRRAAGEIAALLAPAKRRPVPDEAELFAALRSADPAVRERAAAAVRARQLLADGQVVLCLLAAHAPGADPIAAAREAARRLSTGHAVVAASAEGAALLASPGDPVLRTLPQDEVGAWLRAVAGVDVAVGQSAAAGLTTLDEAARQAGVALRAARARTPGRAFAAWSTLGADRLVAQLPDGAHLDVPEPLARLLCTDPALAGTLAAFLDAGGDVKATAAALSLHRSGLYYRLGRIEQLTGLDLARGDDRLLAHLAVRAERMS